MFDLMKKVVESEKSATIRKFRFKNNRGMATNMRTYVCVDNLPFQNIDCMVDADSFYQAVSEHEEAVIEQKDNTLLISKGKFVSTIGLDEIGNLLNIEKQIEGDSIEPGNFLEALEALKPFAGENSVFYATNGYMYYGRDEIIVRTPLNTQFQNIQFVISEVTALIYAAKKPITRIYETKDNLTYEFDFGWLQTGKPNWKLPPNLSVFFEKENFTAAQLEPLTPDMSTHLKTLCKFAGKDDVIDFDNEGVRIIQGTSKKHTINEPMKDRRMIPNKLSPILGLNASFDFDTTARHVAFKTDKLEGYLACLPKPSKEVAPPVAATVSA